MADDDLRVTRSVQIPRAELDVRFRPSGGPGGQHANKTATRVELTFDAASSPSLHPRQRDRVVERLGPVVRIVVDDERSQLRNRALAEARLVDRLAAALHVETPRRATKPSRGAKQRRLEAKKQRSRTKGRPPAAPSRWLGIHAAPPAVRRGFSRRCSHFAPVRALAWCAACTGAHDCRRSRARRCKSLGRRTGEAGPDR